MIAAIKLPLSVGQKVSYFFPGDSWSFSLACQLIPGFLWTWSMSVYFSSLFALLLK